MTQPNRKRRWPWIAATLVVLLVVGAWLLSARLDALLLARVRTEAQLLSEQLGRPIEVEGLSTRFFPRLGVTVRGAGVGAAKDEIDPMLRLERLEVDVLVVPLIQSYGKTVQVKRVEAVGLTMNVVRLADGSTNVSRLQEALARTEKAETAPAGETTPTDLSNVRVDRIALMDGVIRFVDRSGGSGQPLAVSDIDLEVNDLRAGKSLELSIKAAVLDARQNFYLMVKTAPLPPSLVPLPETVALKLAPVELAPLAPYAPQVGLQKGTLEADLRVTLGAALPGGTGPSRLEGEVRGKGLRFAGAEGGKAIDLELLVDVLANALKGDLEIKKLQLHAGPLQAQGQGKVQGLLEGNANVQGLSLVVRGLDPAVLGGYYPPLRKTIGGQIAGPISIEAKGSGGANAQEIQVQVDLSPVRLQIPNEATKEAGAPLQLSARVKSGAERGTLRFGFRVDAQGVDLRPGGLLNKGPQDALLLTVEGTLKPENAKQPLSVVADAMVLKLRNDTLEGKGSYSSGGSKKPAPTVFSAELHSRKVDADALLLEEETPAPSANAKASAPTEPPGNPHRFDGYRGDIDIHLDSLRYSNTDWSKVLVSISMVDDLISVKRFDAHVFSGVIAAGGSNVRLGPASHLRPFTAKVKLQGLEVGEILKSQGKQELAVGRFDGNVDLAGVGMSAESLQRSLLGGLDGSLGDGKLVGTDLVGGVAKPLAAALPFAAKKLPVDGATELGKLIPFSVTVKDGVAQLKKPITWTSSGAAFSFDGGMKLDGALSLAGTIALEPRTISALTAGKVTPTSPIPFALQLAGPIWKPEIRGLDVKPAATLLAKEAAAAGVKSLLGGKAAGVLKDVPLDADAAKRVAAEKEAELKRQAEEKARQEAEKQKQQLQNQAKQRLKGLFGR